MRQTCVKCLLWASALQFACLTGSARQALPPPVFTLDPLCQVEALRPKPLPPGKPAASTLRMIERLRSTFIANEPQSIGFLSDLAAPILQREMEAATDIQRKLAAAFELGMHQAQMGRPDLALNTYAAMEDLMASHQLRPSAGAQTQLRMRRAAALLRLAEQENCILTHGPESCLFPISTAAQHRLPRGSRAAIAVLEEQLTQTPDHIAARWLLNIARMTLGEYPDKIRPEWLIPPSVFASEHPMPRFPDIAGSIGLDINDLAGGSVVDDFDNDGLPDVIASSWGRDGQLRLYRNDGEGGFEERTSEAGLVGLVSGLHLMQTDYNNDGWLDIWVLRGAWLGPAGRVPNSLLRNNRDGTFTDVTEEAGLLSSRPTQTAVWFDYDSDGWLDVFVGNESTNPGQPEPCELFRNNRDGSFTECAASVGLGVVQFVKAVTVADYDNDGRPDLYLSCRDARNLLFHNDGPVADGPSPAWRFSETGQAAGVRQPVFSFPAWFFDFDNDGWEDLFCSGYGINHVGDIAADYLGQPSKAAVPRLYRNNRNGTFADVTREIGMNRVCHTMGCNYGDLDNDGWLDFYLATGDPDLSTLVPNRMFRNDAGKRFQEVTTATGTGHLQKGHGVSFADIDNDGDQDIYTVMGGAFPGDIARNSLFLNPGSSNRWVKLQLVGTRSNRAAIGARIDITVAGPGGRRQIHRTVSSGASFGANSLQQHVGIGNATSIEQVAIRWPGNPEVQVFKGLRPGQAFQLQEGRPEPSRQTLRGVLLGKRAPDASAPTGQP